MVAEGDLLWTPSADMVEGSQLTAYIEWLRTERGLDFADYSALHNWSVTDQEAFWKSLWDHFQIASDGCFDRAMTGSGMTGTRWFEGARINYAEHLLRHEADASDDEVAFYHGSETRPFEAISYRALGDRVRAVATRLRAMGIEPGDRIVAYLPNTIEAVIAMIATTAIGAVWSAAAPEFGAQTVIERFAQIAPRLMLATDGYSFGGKRFDRRDEVRTITRSLPTLETVVTLAYLELGSFDLDGVETRQWESLDTGFGPARADFRFERVAHDHPLWILFSSGTTGLPKAITHSHVGMVLDQTKIMRLNFDLKPGERMFFYTTTGWMMWNAVISALLARASGVLFDGNPMYPSVDALWNIAARTGVTMFGASPTMVKLMEAEGIKPGRLHDLSRINAVILGGAPSTPGDFAWLYENVKPDMRVLNTSGGTELCGSLVGPVPTRPVHAGEFQGRMLGLAIEAWDEQGAPVVNEVGELVITKPFPSMPLYFWGDHDGKRYHEAYFETFPGVWRHGDFIKFNGRGGSYIYGRTDATLNRYGVRIGTSEIYRVVCGIDGVRDAIIVCCETADGGYFMPLFVELEEGASLDASLAAQIKRRLREENSPRHVPDAILDVPAIPYTLTGKRLEVPLRKILMGAPIAKVASPDAMAVPTAIAWYQAYAGRRDVRAMFDGVANVTA